MRNTMTRADRARRGREGNGPWRAQGRARLANVLGGSSTWSDAVGRAYRRVYAPLPTLATSRTVPPLLCCKSSPTVEVP